MEDLRSEFEIQREKGLAQKALDDGELVEYGEPHPITGMRQMRPKSVGATYDIPPDNGTYAPNRVDLTGADAVDINAIMDRIDPAGKQFANAVAQGLLTDAGMKYDNFIEAPDFQNALNLSIHAQQQFNRLPADLRERFGHDPAKFLNYIHDPQKLEEQYLLGLRVRPPREPGPNEQPKPPGNPVAPPNP